MVANDEERDIPSINGLSVEKSNAWTRCKDNRYDFFSTVAMCLRVTVGQVLPRGSLMVGVYARVCLVVSIQVALRSVERFQSRGSSKSAAGGSAVSALCLVEGAFESALHDMHHSFVDATNPEDPLDRLLLREFLYGLIGYPLLDQVGGADEVRAVVRYDGLRERWFHIPKPRRIIRRTVRRCQEYLKMKGHAFRLPTAALQSGLREIAIRAVLPPSHKPKRTHRPSRISILPNQVMPLPELDDFFRQVDEVSDAPLYAAVPSDVGAAESTRRIGRIAEAASRRLQKEPFDADGSCR
uniref:Transposase n=1 Tax=Steinernema glaseri TaxID=37863 RepID=A0A1I8ASW1_9BILA